MNIKEKKDYLMTHNRYWTMNSWNKLSSFAHKMRNILHNIYMWYWENILKREGY